MQILTAFELDEQDRKAIALFYKKKGLADKGRCTLFVVMAIERELEDALEELDEYEHKKKMKKRPKRKSHD